MAYDLNALYGPVLAPETLTSSKARAVWVHVGRAETAYSHQVECRRRKDGTETVFLELDVELSQRPAQPIQPREQVALSFGAADAAFPEVTSLREDFPDVPHLNLLPAGRPKSFCLYAESYAEVKRHWTAHRFVERIRTWLARTAEGILHPDDQALEPLMSMAYGTLVVPAELLIPGPRDLEPYYAVAHEADVPRSVWSVFRPPAEESSPKLQTHVVLVFDCPPQTHGIITAKPETLTELDGFLQRAGFDLAAQARSSFAAWKEKKLFPAVAQARPILLFNLPKRRVGDGPVESTEHVAFLCPCTLEEFERQLGTWSLAKGHTGLVIIPESIERKANVTLLAFEVTPQFCPVQAAWLNALTPEERAFCLLGAGALGSQVFACLLRGGFGRWTVVDHDRLLPHNLARHALGGEYVGWKKSEALCHQAELIMPRKVASSIAANLLKPELPAPLVAALNESLAVLDCTASVAVARRLAAGEIPARRAISMFLNPAADSLVLLVEDEARRCRLDWLEMQYYRAVLREPALKAHFQGAPRGRYSNACRSVTARVSQESISQLAATGSRAFRQGVSDGEAHIAVWQLGANSEVHHHRIPAEPLVTEQINGWIICTDHQLLHNVFSLRQSRLPNETGGVLLGSYDLERRLLYVVDALPSPSDSQEWPTSYVRGWRGLAHAVAQVGELTLDNLEYVGEWHSHPDGCGVGQSETDRRAMAEITAEMASAGLPGLMLIVGWRGLNAFHLAEGA